MSDFGPNVLGQVVQACRNGAPEAAEAFARALDSEGLELSVGEPAKVDMKALPEGFDDAGLVAVLTVGSQGALVAIPERSGLLPDWYANPDPTGQGRLLTLAQELGTILLPYQFMPTDFKVGRVRNLAGAMGRGGITDAAPIVPLQLKRPDGKQATAALVWPADKPAAVLAAGGEPEVAAGAKPKQSKTTAKSKPDGPPKVTLDDLPSYGRSLLRIKVPAVVTLAEKRQTLGHIIELGPGSIIQFDKSCEEMLDLHIGGRRVARGEAVKVGEKFGLRITSVVLPEERFKAVGPKREIDRSPS